MSINVNHPNEDISTSAGNAPTLGGGAPSVNVMSTAAATETQYAKLATLSFPATNNVAANLNFILTPKSASGSYQPVIISATALQATTGLSASSKINVLSTDGLAVAHNDLFFVTSAATNGTDIELYMQSIIAAVYDVQLLSYTLDTGVSLAWNDGATWSATDPTAAAAVSVTSDWPGSGTFTPAISGSTTAGAGTYTAQIGQYRLVNGLCYVNIILQWTAHTGTGNIRVTGLPFEANVTQYLHLYVNNLTYTGDGAQGYITSGTTIVVPVSPTSGGVSSEIAIDTSAQIAVTFVYKVS